MERSLDLEKLFLDNGSHDHPEEGMCVMEAVAYFAGEPFSDQPECVCPVIAEFLRSWNDDLNNEDRQRLKRFIPLVIDTRSTPEIQHQRIWMAVDWAVRIHTPVWLRLIGLNYLARELETLPSLIDNQTAQTALSFLERAKQVVFQRAIELSLPVDCLWNQGFERLWSVLGAEAAWDAFFVGDAISPGCSTRSAVLFCTWDVARNAACLASKTLSAEAVWKDHPSPYQSAEQLLEQMIQLGISPADRD